MTATATKVELRERQRIEAVLQRKDHALSKYLEMATLLEGKKGKGKTFTAVGLCYELRELYGLTIVTIGSKAGLKKDVFGDFQFINVPEFVNQLEKVTDIVEAEESELGLAIDEALKQMGVTIVGAVAVFDEAYKLFDCRTPSDKVVRTFGYFMSQSRHYHLTSLLLSPRRDMIDKRVRQQIDYIGRCYMDKRREVCTTWMSGGGHSWRLIMHNKDPYDLGRPDVYDMYDSWTLLGYRRKHLQIEEA